MSGPSLTVEMALKDNKVLSGLDALAAKEEKVEKGLQGTAKAAKQAEAELARFAKRTTDFNATPVERYQQQVTRLDTALKKGLITQETHTRALKNAQSHVHGTGLSVGNLASAVGGAAAGYLTFQGAIAAANAALVWHKQKTDEAVTSLRELLDVRIELGQVGLAEGDTQQLTRHGLTRKEAAQLALQAKNFGLDQADVGWLAERRAGIGNLTQAAGAAGRVSALFGGAISAREATNLIGQSAESSPLTPDQMGGIIGKAAAGAQPTPESAEQTFAFAGLLAKKYASEEMMATALGFMQTKLAIYAEQEGNEDFKNVPVLDAVKKMVELEQTPAGKARLYTNTNSLLGMDKERNEFFMKSKAVLADMPQAVAEMHRARLATDTPEQWADVVTRRNLADPSIAAGLQAIAAEQGLKAAEEQALGVRGAARNTAQKQVQERAWRRGGNWLQALVIEKTTDTAKAYDASPETVAAMGTRAEALYKGFSTEETWSGRMAAEWRNFFQLFTGRTDETNQLLSNINDKLNSNRGQAIQADAMNHPR